MVENGLGSKASILIIDDHPIVRAGFRQRLSSRPGFCVCGEAGDAAEAMELLPSRQPDVVVLDIALKHENGLDLIGRIKSARPGVRVIVISMYEEFSYVEKSLREGADGYVSKREAPANIVLAVETVLGGAIYLDPTSEKPLKNGARSPREAAPARLELGTLTPRELETFRLFGEGKGVKEIARSLGISTKTVDTYRVRLREKLDIDDHRMLVRRATVWVREQNRSERN